MPSRIRVVEIIHGFGTEGGGAGSFAVELSRRLDKNRFEVCVCGLWEHNRPDEAERIAKLQNEGISAFAASRWEPSKPYAAFLTSLRSIHARLKENRSHILHSHTEFGDAANLFLKPFLKTALVRTVHNGHLVEWRKRPLRRIFMSNLLIPLLYEAEIGVSPHIVSQLDKRALAKRLKKQGLLIHNAIDLEKFQPGSQGRECSPAELKRSLGIPEEGLLSGGVGRLAEGKGWQDFLQAAGIVVQDYPQAHFLIVGEGPEKAELQALVAQAGLGKQVMFAGYRRDIPDLLRCMDVFVSASHWEGLPTSILESMAAGTPVVCTDIPGSREIVKDGENGWIARPDSPQDLARAVKEALRRPDLRQSYARRSLELVSAYSIDSAVDKHMELYEEIVKTPKD
jgi:glycosyltransferase involved in cell wall biosynthesis